jgi:uncharacterized protein (DUF924 family)
MAFTVPPALDRVLTFWFSDLTRADWFRKSDDLDRRIGDEFGGLHASLQASVPYACLTDPKAALAAIIVLDQFSRNIHRGTAQAFASDPHALALAEVSVARGFDKAFEPTCRWFLYLPFEHSEARAVQERSVALFQTLGDDDALKYAMQHKVIIDRFGRYPHRNEILGRTSTPEEIEFLKQPGSSF